MAIKYSCKNYRIFYESQARGRAESFTLEDAEASVDTKVGVLGFGILASVEEGRVLQQVVFRPLGKPYIRKHRSHLVEEEEDDEKDGQPNTKCSDVSEEYAPFNLVKNNKDHCMNLKGIPYIWGKAKISIYFLDTCLSIRTT